MASVSTAPTPAQLALASFALTDDTRQRAAKRSAELAGCILLDSIPPGLEKVGSLVSSCRLPVVFCLGGGDAFDFVECNPDALRIIEVVILRDGSEVPEVLTSNPAEPTVPTLELGDREERVATAYPLIESMQRSSEDTLRAVSDTAHRILTEQLSSLPERSERASDLLVTVWIPVKETRPYYDRISAPRRRFSVSDMLREGSASPV